MLSRPHSKESKPKKRNLSQLASPKEPPLSKALKKSARCTIDSHPQPKASSSIHLRDKDKDKDKKLSSGHSRKLSARKESVDKPKAVLKIHNKSNSLSIRPELMRNTFRIDLSSVANKVHPIQLQSQEGQVLNRGSFTLHYLIGKGGFSKVWSVELKKTHKKYAMKEMLKTKIIEKNSIHSVMSELKLLTELRHPFMVNIFCAFHEREHLYLVMDLLVGGDLRYHLSRRRRFKEAEVKFFLGCIIVGLEYLHYHKVIHRDLKPENLILDKKGYLRITDFGIGRYVKLDNRSDTSGTPGYMAPEVMLKQDHTYTVDYYALGIIAYEFMLGRRPYNGQNRKEIVQAILAKQVQVSPAELPKGWAPESIDFVNGLIQRKFTQRLGHNGMHEIKEHKWFSGFPWSKLMKKEIQTTYIPKSIAENIDYRAQISTCSDEEIDHERRMMLRLKEQEANVDLFEDYQHFPTSTLEPREARDKKSRQKSREKSRKDSKKHSTGTTTGTFNSNHEEAALKKPSRKVIFFH